ncbi:hypothetical protein CERSUDRAFT_92799 [Gelatoporia subvermispora B]|uniref:Nephrocystin 3-like N-terminal domain-containing protein n=1 Tax=Ceriporiopsis subvermispora (strain B) TaxID=914234 RepID=M2RJW6_CERS8|nr:hypothetical protein CERSUDRAFT_92799 [Gelatoporia subvermispora B]
MHSPSSGLDDKTEAEDSYEGPSTVTSILSAAKTVIDAVEPILSVAPGLPGVTKSLSNVIDMVLQTADNDEATKLLAKKLWKFAQITGKAAEDLKKAQSNMGNEDPSLANLRENITELGRDLAKLEDQAMKLQSPFFLFRCWKHVGNAKVILKLNDDLVEARWNWQLRSSVNQGVQLAAVQVEVGAIRDHQDVQARTLLLGKLQPVRAHFRAHPDRDKHFLPEDSQQQLLRRMARWAEGGDQELNNKFICVLSGPKETGKTSIALQLCHSLLEKGLLGASFFFGSADGNKHVVKHVIPTIVAQLASRNDLRNILIDDLSEHFAQDLGNNERLDDQARDYMETPLRKVSENQRPIVLLLDALDVCTDPPDTISKMLQLLLGVARSVKFPLRLVVTSRPGRHIQSIVDSADSRDFVWEEKLASLPKIVDVANFLYQLKDDTRLRRNGQTTQQFPLFTLHIPDVSNDSNATYHNRLANLCLTILMEDKALQRNPLRLTDPSKYGLDPSAHISPSRIGEHIPLHVEYACVAWTTHIQRAKVDTSIIETLEQFCVEKEKLIVWLELLAYLDQVTVALRTLHDVRLWYERNTTPDKPAAQILHDLHRLALEFNDVISICPEQLYISAWPQIPLCPLVERYRTPDGRAMKLATPRDARWASFLFDIQTLRGRIVGIKVNPNGRHIASCALHGQIDLWDAISGVNLLRLTNISGADFFDVSWKDQRVVACCEGGKDIYLYDQSKQQDDEQQSSPPLTWENTRFSSVAFSRDGRIFSPALDSRKVLVWDAEARRVITTIEYERPVSTVIDFAIGGNTAVSGSQDDVCVWDFEKGRILHQFKGHTDSVLSTVFFPCATKVASGGRDRRVRIWDIQNSDNERILEHPDSVTQVVVSPKGDVVASVSDAVRIWNPRSRELLRILKNHNSPVTSICFAMNGLRLVSSSWDGTIRVWDAMTMTSKTEPPHGHKSAVTCLAYSHDGVLVASGSIDKQIVVWDADAGASMQILEGHGSEILHLSFSHDNKRLVSTASQDHSRIWDLDTGSMLMSLTHRDAHLAAFSPDGRWIATSRRSLQKSYPVDRLDIWHSDIRLFNAADGGFHMDFNLPSNVGNITIQTLEFHPPHANAETDPFSQIYVTCTSGAVYSCNIKTETGLAVLVPERQVPNVISSKFTASPHYGWVTLPGPKKQMDPVCWLQKSRRPAARGSIVGHDGDVSASTGLKFATGSATGRVTLLDLSELLPTDPTSRSPVPDKLKKTRSLLEIAVIAKNKSTASGEDSIADTLPDVGQALAAVGASLSELKSIPMFGGLEHAIYSLCSLTDILQVTQGKEDLKRELVRKIEELYENISQSRTAIGSIDNASFGTVILKRSSPLMTLLEVIDDLADMLELFATLQEIEQVDAKRFYVRFKQKARSRKTDVMFAVKDSLEDAYGAVAYIVSRGRVKLAKLISEVSIASDRILAVVKQLEDQITQEGSLRLQRQRGVDMSQGGVAQPRIYFDRGRNSARDKERLQLLQTLVDLAEGITVNKEL